MPISNIAGFDGVNLAGPAYGDLFGAPGSFYQDTPSFVVPATPSGQITGTHTSGVTLSAAAYADPVTVAATATIAVGGDQSTGIVDDFKGRAWKIDNLGLISAGYGIRLNSGGTVNNSGAIAGFEAAVYISGGVGTVTNSGLMDNGQYAVRLAGGGDVTNKAGATLSGSSRGVDISGGSSTVTNSGNIFSGREAVYLDAGMVTNAKGGMISGASGSGVFVGSGAGAVYNDGSITGGQTGIYLTHGGKVTNANGAMISAGGHSSYGVNVNRAAGAVYNYGSLTSAGGGIYLADGGKVTNANGAMISGANTGVVVNRAACAVYNYGSITGAGGGIFLAYGGKVINANGGIISGGVDVDTKEGYGPIVDGAEGFLGAAKGRIHHDYDPVVGIPGMIYNYGSITGGQYGVALQGGGSLTNGAHATIMGGDFGVASDHYRYTTIINSGTIQGTNKYGVETIFGNITNASGATISGKLIGVYDHYGAVENAGTISGGLASVKFDAYGSGVVNRLIVDGGAVFNGIVEVGPVEKSIIELTAKDGAGTLKGLGSQYVGFQTVTIDSGAHWTIGAASVAETIDNSGTVSNAGNGIELDAGGAVDNFGSVIASAGPGNQSIGVYLSAGGSITNEAGAYISGAFGVVMNGSGTVENAGTISGAADAVKFGSTGANRLIVDGGAAFRGAITANATGANTIELTAKSGVGTLTGLGSQCVGFQTVTIDPGAVWTVTGTAAGFAATKIAGSPTNDTLDVTDLAYAKGDTAKLAGHVLEILNATKTVIESFTLAHTVSLAGTKFRVASDGAAGTPGTEVTISDPRLAYWEGSAGGAWSVASNWSGAAPNGPAVAVDIFQYAASPYGVFVDQGQSFSLLSLTIDSASANLVLQGALKATKGLTLTAGSVTLQGGSFTGAVTIKPGTTMSGNGAVTGPITDGGLVDAQGGTLKITGAVTGRGALQIESGASLELGGAFSTITFSAAASPAETLILDKPASPFKPINGFAVGDTIDLKGIAATSGNYYRGLLSVYNGTTTVARLTIPGPWTYGMTSFALASDNAGGTDITLAAGAAGAAASAAQLNLFKQYVAAGFDIRPLDAVASDIPNVLDHNVMLAVHP